MRMRLLSVRHNALNVSVYFCNLCQIKLATVDVELLSFFSVTGCRDFFAAASIIFENLSTASSMSPISAKFIFLNSKIICCTSLDCRAETNFSGVWIPFKLSR